MKIPSLTYLFDFARASAKRFPLTLLCSVMASGIAIYLVESENEIDNVFPFVNSMLCLALGIPLFFCVSVFSEKENLNKTKKLGLTAFGILLMVLLYISFPSSGDSHNLRVPYIRYGIYNAALHLMVAFVPYWKDSNYNGFWQYNKALFLRICLAVLYSAFVYLGLVLALVSIDELFNANIDGELYFELFIITTGVFNTWFFISGIPEDYDSLEENDTYPKGLKIFGQYILLPLLIIYLVILYSYAAKVFILWDWPKGLVSYLVSGVATLGIFTLLIIYPYQRLKENKWFSVFSKYYYYLLIPLIAMLFLAIGFRLSDYGVTINRYAIVTLGIWLAGISFYFIAGGQNIKIVPISLSGVILLISFGPWGMFSVSENSQYGRLKDILHDEGILSNEMITNQVNLSWDSTSGTLKGPMSNEGILIDSLHNEVYSIMNYLYSYHGTIAAQPWLKQDLSAFKKERKAWNNYTELQMRAMGIHGYTKYHQEFRNHYFSLQGEDVHRVRIVSDYDYMAQVSYSNWTTSEGEVLSQQTGDGKHDIVVYQKDSLLKISLEEVDTVMVNLESMKRRLLKGNKGSARNYNIPLEQLTMTASKGDFKVKLEFLHIDFAEGDTVNTRGFSANLYLKAPEESP